MKRILNSVFIVLLIYACMLNHSISADNKTDAAYFKEANEFYKKGDYQNALTNYYKINGKTFTVYFNMGNCYAKLNKKGYALYFYKTAKNIAPRNERINANINIIRATRNDKFDSKKNALTALCEQIVNSYSLRGSFILVSIFLWVLCILACFRLFYKNKILNVLLIINAVAFISAAPFFAAKILENDEAVLIENNVKLRSEPLVESTELAHLNEATEAKILSYTDNWIEVIVADSHKGWLSKKSLLIIKK